MIEIPLEVVRRESETVAAQYARAVRIPGFRPGRAPADLVRRRFRDDIRNEVVQSLLPRFFRNAIQDQKLTIVGRPRFEELKFEDDQPLTCKATFEVYPQFELKDYQGLEVEEVQKPVTDADVDQALEELRERAATFEVVQDRPAADDDILMVSYQGRNLQDPAAKPVEAHDAVVRLAAPGTLPAFTENLRGVRAGEEREFEFTYPEDFPQPSLAGKPLRYHVRVESVKRKVLPAVNDELAASLSEFSTLEELRAQLRKDLEANRKRQEEAETRQKLIEQLLERHEFPVPEALVEAQLQVKLEKLITQLAAQGIDPRSAELDWAKIREQSRPAAEKEVRGGVILERIAETEKIEVSEEELDETIREMAQQEHVAPAALKTRLTRDGVVDTLRSRRRNQKTLDFIYRQAKIIRKSG